MEESQVIDVAGRVRQQLGRNRVPKRLKTKAAEREVVLAARVAVILRKQQDSWPDRCGAGQ